MHLEPLERGLGMRPEHSVQRTGFVAQAAQQALYLEDTRSGPPHLAVGTQRRSGLGADDAVCRKAMRLLETPNGALGQRAVEAIDWTRDVRLVAEDAL